MAGFTETQVAILNAVDVVGSWGDVTSLRHQRKISELTVMDSGCIANDHNAMTHVDCGIN